MERATGEANNIAHPRIVSVATTQFYTVGCGWFLWNAIPLPCILRLMSQPLNYQPPPTIVNDDRPGLKWWQGLDRYCWIVLVISALGWMFDTMDQNLYNLVRAPSLSSLLRPLHTDAAGAVDAAALAADVKQKGGWITAIFLVGWSVGGFVFGILGDRLGRTRTMIITIL